MQLHYSTETAVRVLAHLATRSDDRPVPLRELGEAVGGSSTYLAKTVNDLVRARLLLSFRGARGGVVLARASERITLLDVVEAVQGELGASYCADAPTGEAVCGFHEAMVEVRRAMARILGRWTLAAIIEGGARAETCKLRQLAAARTAQEPRRMA
jgi:Rrf2 family protein